MMEIVQKCQNLATSAEEHGPCQRLGHDSNPVPSSEPDLNPGQEMQWSLAEEDCACSDLSLNRQAFLIPPQDLGWDLSRSPPFERGPLSREASLQDCEELLGHGERPSGGFEEPGRWPHKKTPGEGPASERTRLPSIVVEPSEGSDAELLWPPEDFPFLGGAERGEFLAAEELEAGFSSFESDVEELLL